MLGPKGKFFDFYVENLHLSLGHKIFKGRDIKETNRKFLRSEFLRRTLAYDLKSPFYERETFDYNINNMYNLRSYF